MWETFDNTYFLHLFQNIDKYKKVESENGLIFWRNEDTDEVFYKTDMILMEDKGFKAHVDEY